MEPIKYLSRFEQKYPLELSLVLETMDRFADIAQNIYSDTRIPLRKIEFLIGEHGETNKPTLMMPELDGMLFIAAITRTAIDHVLNAEDNTGNLKAKLAERARRCPTKLPISMTMVSKCHNCGHKNKYYENYCTLCGNSQGEMEN